MTDQNRTCAVAGCASQSRVLAMGLCVTHWSRQRKYGDPGGPDLQRRRQKGLVCSVDGCNAECLSRGMCEPHYHAWHRTGDPTNRPRAITRGGRPYGLGTVNHAGYVMVGGGSRGKMVMEHRLVMETHLGRKLVPGETVHHISGDRLDNRLENLELWSKAQPSGQRIADKIAWAIELLEMYAPDALSGQPYQLRI